MTLAAFASRLVPLLGVLACLVAAPAPAQRAPLEIDVSGAQFRPLPVAMLPFTASEPALAGAAESIGAIVEADLQRSGLFRLIPRAAFLSTDVPFDTMPAFEDWRVLEAEALITGRVYRAPDGRLQVQYRVFDVLAGEQLHSQQLPQDAAQPRRVSHQIADGVLTALTGEAPYFDSRIAFIDETGPKGDRRKRLAVMDQDGANVVYPGADGLVLTPQFSPDGQRLLYISYDTGQPEIFLIGAGGGSQRRLGNFPGMSFGPRFSPNGNEVLLSLTEGGNTDLYLLGLNGGLRRLTSNPAIDTSGSFDPDGRRIVFESDRGGSQQIYVMPASGGAAQRISFGEGSYGTPVWSPKGDLIAFTKIRAGRFHIGVMRPDGSGERLLTTSFLDEGPSFSPNGRFVVFYRESPGQQGRAQLLSVDVIGRNERLVATPNAASDPSWSPLRR